MIQQPERNSKLSPKFVGPYKVGRYIYGNKFEVMKPNSNVTLVTRSDHLMTLPCPKILNKQTELRIVTIENTKNNQHHTHIT